MTLGPEIPSRPEDLDVWMEDINSKDNPLMTDTIDDAIEQMFSPCGDLRRFIHLCKYRFGLYVAQSKKDNSSTTHKKLRLYVFPSFREFKKILPNTFIYKPILIKIYIYTNIINTQIFHLNKYDLKGH